MTHRFIPWPWLLLFVALAFAFAGSRPLWEPDEGRYAMTGLNMAASGDWLVPRLAGQPHLTKPPLTYWAIAAGIKIFSASEWGARFFLSFAFFGTILSVIALGRAWGWRQDEALASGLVYATSLLPFVTGHVLTTDTFLTFWETLGVLCAWRVWSGSGSPARWRALFWIAFGLAFLTKGPPGWLPLLVILFFVSLGRPARPDARLRSWPLVGLMLVLALSWFIVLILKDPSLIRKFLVGEVVDRVFTDVHGRARPVYFYLIVLGGGLFPWVFLWPALLRNAARWLGPAWRRQVDLLAAEPALPACLRPCPLGQGRWKIHLLAAAANLLPFLLLKPALIRKARAHVREGWTPLSDPMLFSLLWMAICFLIFTLSNSKMFFYATPLFVPLSLWASRELARRYRGWIKLPLHRRRAIASVLAAWLIVLFVLAGWPDRAPGSKSHRRLGRELAQLSPQALKKIYCLGKPVSTISFYSRVPFECIDTDVDEIPDFLAQRVLAEGTVGVLMKQNEYRKLKRRYEGNVSLRIVAEDHDYTVLTVDPPAAASVIR